MTRSVYACMLDAALANGLEDTNGILIYPFPDYGIVGGTLTQSHDRQAFPE